MKDDFLNINKLQIGYSDPLTEQINISIGEGNLICIIGRNGTGKSTLLKTLSGIIKPIAGQILYKNQNLDQLKATERASIISFVPSRHEYLSNLRVMDLVSMGRSLYTNIFDKKSENDIEIINKALKEFDLIKLADKYLYSISDGERQKAMICRAFVQETPIILMDEPTAFLDYYSKTRLLDNLYKLATRNNKCIIFSTHDLEIAFRIVTKVWLFEHNQISQYSISDLKKNGILENVLGFKFESLK